MSVIGIDVGGTGIKAARFADDGAVLERATVATPGNGNEIADCVLALAGELAAADVRAAGVVLPGVIAPGTGVVRYSANLNWRDVPLRDLLADRLGVAVAVDNDVNAAALAESSHGEGDLLFVSLGTGIGGAFVHRGEALRGSTGLAGEIGHTPTRPDGESCTCGQIGCLEIYASASGVARRYAAAGGSPGLTAADLADRLDTDAVAARVWDDATSTLGLALATAVLLFDPDRIVLGGGLAEAGDALLVPTRAELDRRLTWRPAPPLARSTLGLDAGVHGAAALARQLLDPATGSDTGSDTGKAGCAR